MTELFVPLQNPSSLFRVPFLISSKICVSSKCRQLVSIGFPVGAVVKTLSAVQETQEMWVRFLGLGRSPGEGNGNPLQQSCLGNPMDRGAWRAIVLVGHKESDTTEHSDKHSSVHIRVTKISITWHLPKSEAGRPVRRQKYLERGGDVYYNKHHRISYLLSSHFHGLTHLILSKLHEVIVSIFQIQKLRFKSIVQGHKIVITG